MSEKRKYNPELKAEAVKHVNEQGLTQAEAGQKLGIPKETPRSPTPRRDDPEHEIREVMMIGELETKPDYARAMERVEAWFAGVLLDRPPVRFTRHNAEFEAEASGFDEAALRKRWFDVEYRVSAFVASLGGRHFHGETFPVFWPNLGPDVYAAFYGCPLRFGDATSWSIHCLHEKGDIDALRFDSACEYMVTLEALTRRALEEAEGRFLVGYTDLHPGIDTAAAFRGQAEFCLDLYDDPDYARALLDLASRDFGPIYDRFDSVLKREGMPSVTWMGIPAPGKMHVPSCDFASMLSPEHFEEFVYPELDRQCRMMSHNVFHVDGKGVARHLDRLLELPGVQGYQWVQGVGDDEPILQWVSLIKKIQGRGKGVVVDLKTSELEAFMEEVRPKGIYLCVGTDDEDEELAIIRRLEKWR
jgi:hypothetical protein